MRKLTSFLQVSLDGYYADSHGEMNWAKKEDAEFSAFAAENARRGGVLMFGRITYELMASFWPTPLAAQHAPIVAERMNNLPKVVFSRTLEQASWNNTKLLQGDLAAEVRKMKHEPGHDMAILGSGSIVSKLAEEGLIDEYQIVVNPLGLGAGKAIFAGVHATLNLRLTESRVFGNGNVFLRYQPLSGTGSPCFKT